MVVGGARGSLAVAVVTVLVVGRGWAFAGVVVVAAGGGGGVAVGAGGARGGRRGEAAGRVGRGFSGMVRGWGRRGLSFQEVHALVATPFGSSVGKPNLVFNEEISPRAEFL